MADWSHKSQNEWGEQFPISVAGKRQSPIDIRQADATKEERGPLELKLIAGDKNANWTLTNNGHTFAMAPPKGVEWQLSGGVLEGTYVLNHFHAHWANCSGHGCEHLLDGQRFDGETHFVFALTPDKEGLEDKFVAYGLMMNQADKSDATSQCLFDHIGQYMDKVQPSGSKVEIPAIDLDKMAAANKGKEYFAYKGSLTTPPFAEAVLHIVFASPFDVNKEVFDKLRNLGDVTGGKSTINYRAIQPLNKRKIHHCVA